MTAGTGSHPNDPHVEALGTVRQVTPPPAARALSTLCHIDYEDAFLAETGPAQDRTGGQRARAILANAAIPPALHARRVQVPSGFSLFPGDIIRPPRAWLERTANVVRVTEPARGGHFAPFEAAELYAGELRAFFRPYREAATG